MKTYLKTQQVVALAGWVMVLMGGTTYTLAQVSPAPTVAAQHERVQGEVVRIDAARSRITLRHARIKSIGMEAMTMPFKVNDAVMLDQLKPGDKVQFSVAMQDDELRITHLIPVRAAK